ncbi:hypothetical protein JCM11251_007534 [Rhodosporidiobolus azoricus]
MAASFIGLPVLIKLLPSATSTAGDSCEGVLSSLDPQQGTITLTEAKTTVGGVSRMEGIRVLRREEVAGLELLSVDRGGGGGGMLAAGERAQEDGVRRATQQQQQQHHQPRPAPHPQHHNQNPSAHHQYQMQQHSFPSPMPPPSPMSGSPKPVGGKKRNRRPKNGNNRLPWQDDTDANGGGDEADVSTAYGDEDSHSRRRQAQVAQRGGGHSAAPSFDEDFDFGAGLASFDKARVFEQIRETDTIDPSLRLHAHNRNPHQPGRSLTPQQRQTAAGQVKLLPNENVLSQRELEEQQEERSASLAARAEGSRAASVAGGSDTASVSASAEASEYEDAPGTGKGLSRAQSRLRNLVLQDDGEGEVGELVTVSGFKVPTVTRRQWREALSIAEIESSPTPFQRIEHSACFLVSYILELLSSSTSLSKAPKVALLTTPCTHGLIALRAGTLLAHRGVKITALIVDEESGSVGEEWRTALRVLSGAGGRVVKDEVADLPAANTFSLILDALSDPITTSPSSSSNPLSASTSSLSLPLSPRPDADSSTAAADAVAWANSVSNHGSLVAKLSLAMPYGIDAETGAVLPLMSASRPFLATHIISFALPHPALSSVLRDTPALKTVIADVGFPPRLWERVGVVDEANEVVGLWGLEARGWVEVRVR